MNIETIKALCPNRQSRTRKAGMVIKNCPGCGCQPSVWKQSYVSNATGELYDMWSVRCMDTNCIVDVSKAKDKAEAIANWNSKMAHEKILH